jgi:hypothetical protein
MRFDAAKAVETFQELGDPRFKGPDGETWVADFVAEHFARMGLTVERREVVGSRLPQRVAPWIGWIGYGGLITVEYALLLSNSLIPSLLAVAVSAWSVRWLWLVISNSIHVGRHLPPRESAPMVIASPQGDRSAAVRVVFQALLGGLEPDLSHLVSWSRFAACLLLSGFPFLLLFMGFGAEPSVGFLIFVWAWVLWCLFDEYRWSRRLARSPRPEEYGLALLMELARNWPRTGSRSIEPVFVAAGGQRLDYAGSREVVRLLGSEWTPRPSLIVRFFAAGAGEKIWLSTNDRRTAGTLDLALEAGRSLWIPVAMARPWTWLPLMALCPLDDPRPAIALIGARSSPSSHASADPQALHRAAQLATEIALRWAKRQQQPAQAPASVT